MSETLIVWLSPVLVKLTVLLTALSLDLLLGEPPSKLHPTVWVGRYVMFLERRVRGRLGGVLLVTSSLALFTSTFYLALRLLSTALPTFIYLFLVAALLKTTFAIKSMEQHVEPIVESMANGDLEAARLFVSRIVSRDTRRLSRSQLISASVESIGENTVDGVTSPLLYFALLGFLGALAYRVINTLDSMVGYRHPPFTHLGWAAAKLDSLANYVPARVTGCLMVCAAWLAGMDWRRALRVLRRDRGRTDSLNSGWPLSAMAGALRVQLEKPGFYTLGDGLEELSISHVRAALRLMKLTVALFIALAVVPLTALGSALGLTLL
ncbi:MAG: cobalamin biosynthesis protein [Thermoprotei archaeon]|nr:MAG: cobalamin biosynthesis protein [Thermoprotei archaeon]